MTTPLSVFVVMFVVQFLSYLNLTINFRAIAHKQVRWAVGTDAIASCFQYFIIARVAQEGTLVALAGMVCGGACASAVGIYITSHWGEDEESNHVCVVCQKDCDCPGKHMMTDCTGCYSCRVKQSGDQRRALSKLHEENTRLAAENKQLQYTLEEL